MINLNKPLVDTTWNCMCGALNAGYRETCGKCNKTKTNERKTI